MKVEHPENERRTPVLSPSENEKMEGVRRQWW